MEANCRGTNKHQSGDLNVQKSIIVLPVMFIYIYRYAVPCCNMDLFVSLIVCDFVLYIFHMSHVYYSSEARIHSKQPVETRRGCVDLQEIERERKKIIMVLLSDHIYRKITIPHLVARCSGIMLAANFRCRCLHRWSLAAYTYILANIVCASVFVDFFSQVFSPV